jgi:uncharacterized radical SAM superfamily Fe-S cluster-containing enzyme
MAFYHPDYDRFLGATQSFCHLCNDKTRLIDTHIVTYGKRVYLRKFCPACGESKVCISDDLDYYRLCEAYLKKPDLPECALTPVKRGCPFDCGVCPQHQNHPCLALFNVIDECNMRCRICYHASEPGKGNVRSMQEIEAMLHTLLQVESEPDLVQVTGGEPTLHPHIIDILRMLKASPVRHVMLNTNGIRIAEDDTFVQALHTLGGGFEVYLQFDSLRSEALRTIRGADMRKIRLQALECLERYHISVTLVCVIWHGVNDDEIGEIIDFARRYRCVRGVVFQPIQAEGRIEAEGSYRITLSQIRRRIVDDARNPFEEKDMIPLPCDPHKICVGYAAKKMDDGYASLRPVTGALPKALILDHKGTVAFEQDEGFVKTVVSTVGLETALGEAIVADAVKRKLFCCWPSFLSPERMGYEHVFRIVIMEFSDRYNFNTTDIKRECNFIIEPGRAIPFSTYNMGLYRNDIQTS